MMQNFGMTIRIDRNQFQIVQTEAVVAWINAITSFFKHI